MQEHGKKGRKRTAAGVILFAALFYIGELLFFCLTSAEVSSWGRRILNQMYSQNPIEAGFFGGSQVLYGVDCGVAESRLGKKVSNLTSSQQPLTGTDAVLRETIDHHPEMKTAYISLDYSLVMVEEVNLESIYIVSDAMKPSWNKARYLLHTTPQEYYLNSFLPLRKGESYSVSSERIRDNLKVLSNPFYRTTQYAGGFAPNDGMSQETYDALQKQYAGQQSALPEENGSVVIPSRSEWAIRDMIAFCQKKDVQIVFFATPVPEFVTDSVTNYEKYVDAVNDILQDSGVTYLDYNCSSFDRSRADYYNDDFHLSGSGAAEFTSQLCEDLMKKSADRTK